MKVAVIGAGWAGCAGAVEATRLGHKVTLFEATRTAGGRARRVEVTLDHQSQTLDNGQHILIGAYSETLKLMAELGLDASAVFLRVPLSMQFPDGNGLKLARLPTPLDALVGICTARGWNWRDKLSLLKVSIGWRMAKFQCAPQQSVADLCSHVSPRIMTTLIEPLCVSALNTPVDRASGQVFLTVMRDALFSGSGGSNLLLPRVDLSALLPDAALAWLEKNGAVVKLGNRVQHIGPSDASGASWVLEGVASDATTNLGVFDRVVIACQPTEAARLAEHCRLPCEPWLARASELRHEAITTVYAMGQGARLSQPMLALRSSADHPAQFVFDRGQLGGPAGLLAFVVSASVGDKASITAQVLQQAATQLGLNDLQPIQAIVEKRATFACTPGLQRPGMKVAPGLLACGDYIDGPYPATLEGAVRSGLAAARQLE
ncbi:MAG: FAD-dependent oxidoreductase [Polaromonas sp.]|nr:FAD-dependent oxidoreductase [Polaromonas sp.]